MLRGQTIGTDSELEYGADQVKMHVDAISPSFRRNQRQSL
jgi:hypothetical protein